MKVIDDIKITYHPLKKWWVGRKVKGEKLETLLTMKIQRRFTKFDLKQVYRFASSFNIDIYQPIFEEIYNETSINTALRFAAFLAQVGHESAQLRYVKEIASGRAYEGRKDLGNVERGDGMRFKGRGLIQITGRANYTELTRDFCIDFLNYPEILELPEYAAKSAVWFWEKRKLNRWADEPDFIKVTKIVNGGLNGYQDRLELYDRAKQVI